MTDKISAELIIVIDGTSISEQFDSSQLHIEDDESGLKIYVPADERRRDICYLSDLPKRLVEWMMTDPVTQIKYNVDPKMFFVTQAILNAKASLAEHLLDDNGIIEPDSLPDDNEIIEAEYLDDISIIRASHVDHEPDEVDEIGPPEYLDSFTESSREQGRPVSNGHYRALLVQVVAAARRSGILSQSFDLSELAGSLAGESSTENRIFDEFSVFGINMVPRTERAKMVGAAGELFVSFVSACATPKFGSRLSRNSLTPLLGFRASLVAESAPSRIRS